MQEEGHHEIRVPHEMNAFENNLSILGRSPKPCDWLE